MSREDILKKNGIKTQTPNTVQNISNDSRSEILRKNGITISPTQTSATTKQSAFNILNNATSSQNYDSLVQTKENTNNSAVTLKGPMQALDAIKGGNKFERTLAERQNKRNAGLMVEEAPLFTPIGLAEAGSNPIQLVEAHRQAEKELSNINQAEKEAGNYEKYMGNEYSKLGEYQNKLNDSIRGADINQMARDMVALKNAEAGKEVQDLSKYYDAGATQSNYILGNLNVRYNEAMAKYLKTQKMSDLNEAERIKELINLYNEKAENVGEGGIIRKDFAGYAPQLVGQTISGVEGALAGAGAGALTGAGIGSVVPGAGTTAGASTGALWGARVGYVAGVGSFSYDQMRGSAYSQLLDLGIPDDVAREVASDTALWQSVIEMTGTVIDLASLGLGSKAVKGVAGKTAGQLTAKQLIKNALKAYGINLVEETAEESIQEKIAIEEEKKAFEKAGVERTTTDEEDWQRIVEAGAGGFKIALVSGGGNVIGNITATSINSSTISKVNKTYDEQINKIKTSNLSEQQKQEQINILEEGRKKTVNAIKDAMTETEGNKIINVNNLQENVTPQSPNTQIQQQTNEIIPQQTENQQNANMVQNNTQIAQNIPNNVQTSQNNMQNAQDLQKTGQLPLHIQTFVDNRAITSPGLTVIADETLTSDGMIEKRADGTRVIKINPKSTRAYEFVVVHEMMHDLEGTQEFQELYKYVKNRAISHNEFESAKKAITEQYTKYYTENNLDMSNLNMDIETTNDMVAQALGNQQFLNELAGQKPNVFMRLYNWVKNVAFDGNKTGKTFSERRADNKYLQELKNKFETAYNTAYKGNRTNQYNVGYDVNNKPFIIIEEDILQNIPQKEWISKVKEVFKNKFPNGIDMNFFNIAINAKSKNEFVNSEYTRNLKRNNKQIYSDKMRMANNVDEIVQNAYNIRNEDLRHSRNDNIGSFNRSNIDIRIGNRDYTIDVVTGITKNNKEIFYDIVNIKKKASPIRISTQGVESKNGIPSNNSIPQTTEKIKNSTQSSFSLGENSLPKVQKGYTRLYRGLTQKYDANYDKRKIDNSNGYESWTDNYELAKAYGDNVYYIDVPTSVIKDSIIDENDKSETYGDRNLIYRNNKSVGIKGKSGNEYMLYTDHDDFGNIQYNEISQSNNLPKTDNQGRELTKEQQEYFKNSQIRNRDGFLLALYHGTNQDFNIFDIKKLGNNMKSAGNYGDGFYFTQNKDSAIWYSGGNGNLKEVYLNIKNPFSYLELYNYNGEEYYTDYLKIAKLVEMNPEWGNIPISYGKKQTWGNIETDIKELLHQNKSDAEIDNIMYDKYGDLPENLNEVIHSYAKNNGAKTLRERLVELGFDGIIISDTAETSNEIIAFYPNQIKSVDNTNPTDDPDIRYSQSNNEWQKYLDKNWDLMPNTTKTFGLPSVEQLQARDLKQGEEISNTLNMKKQEDGLKEAIDNVSKNDKANKVSYTTDFYRNMRNALGEKAGRELTGMFDNQKLAYVKFKQKFANELKRYVVDKLGIKPGSEMSADVQRFGEKIITETELKTKYPNNWQNIVEADKWFRAKYNELIDAINATREDIYPNVEEQVQQTKESLLKTYDLIKEAEKIGIAPYKVDQDIQDNIKRLEERIESKKEKIKEIEDANRPNYRKTKKYNSLIEQLQQLEQNKNELERTLGTRYDEKVARLKKRAQRLSDTLNSEELWRGKRIPKRDNYYRHFQEMAEGFKALHNIFETPAEISSQLAGTSEYTKPNAKFLGLAQKRTTNETEYDAVKGFLNYLDPASYAINIDPFTANLRAITKTIKENTVYTKNANKLIEYLDDFTNSLAGKTNPFDRLPQKLTSRKTMKAIEWMGNRIKSNAVLGNINSSISQILNLPQVVGKIKNPVKLAQGLTDLASGKGKYQDSQFIQERYHSDIDSQFKTKLLQQPKKFATWMLGALDETVTKTGWNAVYRQAIEKGIDNPIQYADDTMRDLVAGRGIGERSLAQESKLVNLLMPFTVETGNYWRVMKDFVKEKDFGGILITYIVGWLINRGIEALGASGKTFDPIDAIYDAITEEDISILERVGRVGGEFLSSMPFGQQLAAIYPEYGADLGVFKLPGREDLFGSNDPTRFGTGSMFTNIFEHPVTSLAMPWGGTQLRRTLEGAEALLKGGDYKTNSKGEEQLKFPVDLSELEPNEKMLKAIQVLTLGKYATPEAQNYFDNGALSVVQTKGLKEAQKRGISSKKFYEIRDKIKAIEVPTRKNKEGKDEAIPGARKKLIIEELNKTDLNSEQKKLFYDIFYSQELK